MGKPAAGSLAKAFEASSGKPLEGIAHGDAPTIYETDKNVAFVHMGTPTVTVSIPADQALASLIKGFQTDGAQRLFDDERFRTAVDLYAAASFEQSPAARLLTLSMAFEVLAPVTYKHDAVRKLAERWKNDVADARALYANDPVATAALDSFERELLFRQETSISGRIRECVFNELGGDDQARVQAKRVLSAYDARSKLLHDGRLDSEVRGKAIGDFTEVFRLIVVQRFRTTAA